MPALSSKAPLSSEPRAFRLSVAGWPVSAGMPGRFQPEQVALDFRTCGARTAKRQSLVCPIHSRGIGQRLDKSVMKFC